ncbi:DUF1826 domain-containing protein [Microbulbifer elongatus]|uniref:DUF1826 domain-containing protein n=1 Tax=Microbulbifer elongatus TaxID=86173 RepID=A0ABT1P2G2_9GAMM|nr:DUF1826 domain-containing protein [Microbulbifer elongatus]MCQ3830286.1 DUF1826 domain-containing protein [Microbulbifer elongatus]
MSSVNVAQKAFHGAVDQNNLPRVTPVHVVGGAGIAPSIQPDRAASPVSRRAAFTPTPDAFADIYEDEVHLSIWQRRLEPALIEECSAFLNQKGFNSHRLVVPAAKIQNLGDVIPGLDAFPNLCADIELLADMFTCLFDLNAIGIRLSVLSDTMCPRFHVDRVPCRLITTYSGVATEWLPHDQLDRSKLGAGSGGLSDAESGLYPSTQSIQSMAAGEVALLKGELWAGNEGAGLVHRSPAVAPGSQRLILTFDFASSDD